MASDCAGAKAMREAAGVTYDNGFGGCAHGLTSCELCDLRAEVERLRGQYEGAISALAACQAIVNTQAAEVARLTAQGNKLAANVIAHKSHSEAIGAERDAALATIERVRNLAVEIGESPFSHAYVGCVQRRKALRGEDGT